VVHDRALYGAQWSDSHSAHLDLEERVPSTHWIEEWVGHRADLDVRRKQFLPLPETELRLIP